MRVLPHANRAVLQGLVQSPFSCTAVLGKAQGGTSATLEPWMPLLTNKSGLRLQGEDDHEAGA
jgi:hypothetical protein